MRCAQQNLILYLWFEVQPAFLFALMTSKTESQLGLQPHSLRLQSAALIFPLINNTYRLLPPVPAQACLLGFVTFVRH